MYIVTGGAGFIGANIVDGLNQRGDTDILVVDDLQQGDRFLNIRDLAIADYMDHAAFRARLNEGGFKNSRIRAVFHQGACSDTMEADGRYMMDNNYTFSKEILHFCLKEKIPLVYASSAAVYGASETFAEHPDNERPLNVYGYSKLLFDRYAERLLPEAKSTVAGLRYFNVYGPREGQKGRMASMVHQLHNQILYTGIAKLFEGTSGYGHGEQRRDFIYVADTVRVNLFLADGGPHKGVFNVGTGASRSFNDIVNILFQKVGKGEIQYKPLPEGLEKKYQSFTEADITRLRATGYDAPFTSLEAGIEATVELEKQRAARG